MQKGTNQPLFSGLHIDCVDQLISDTQLGISDWRFPSSSDKNRFPACIYILIGTTALYAFRRDYSLEQANDLMCKYTIPLYAYIDECIFAPDCRADSLVQSLVWSKYYIYMHDVRCGSPILVDRCMKIILSRRDIQDISIGGYLWWSGSIILINVRVNAVRVLCSLR